MTFIFFQDQEWSFMLSLYVSMDKRIHLHDNWAHYIKWRLFDVAESLSWAYTVRISDPILTQFNSFQSNQISALSGVVCCSVFGWWETDQLLQKGGHSDISQILVGHFQVLAVEGKSWVDSPSQWLYSHCTSRTSEGAMVAWCAMWSEYMYSKT